MNDRDRINRAVKRDIARALISNPFTLIPVEGPEREREERVRGERERESRRDTVTHVIDQAKGERIHRTQPVTRVNPAILKTTVLLCYKTRAVTFHDGYMGENTLVKARAIEKLLRGVLYGKIDATALTSR